MNAPESREGRVLSGRFVLDGAVNGDPVLSSLDQTREVYTKEKEVWEHRADELAQQARQAQEQQKQTADELRQARAQLARERQRAEHQKERANRLAESLKSVHRALFDGNVFSLILKACLGVTGGTRGLYVSVWGGDRFRVRAAVEMGQAVERPPSPFIEALCREALEGQKTILINQPDKQSDLPKPGPHETFRNCMVAPAVLLKEMSGVVILADKVSGDFDEHDAEIVLSVGDQAAVAVENGRLQKELADAYFSIVGVLADAVEAKDPNLHGHCELVANYSRRTAERMQLTEVERGVACYGGLLHDVGKIGVSDGVLNKMGKLGPEEWTLMQSHVRVGRDLLSWVPAALGQVAAVVMHHHERFDGTGYPDGLQGEAIPLAARIVGVVDAYCAMTVRRSYKESVADAEARAELTRCKGTHFDPAVVDAFLSVLDAPRDDEDDLVFAFAPGSDHLNDFRSLLQSSRPEAASGN